VGEESVAAGVRRIEALPIGAGALRTGPACSSVAKQRRRGSSRHGRKADPNHAPTGKQLRPTAQRGPSANSTSWRQAQTIKGTKVVVAQVEGLTGMASGRLVDSLRQKQAPGSWYWDRPKTTKAPDRRGHQRPHRFHAGKMIQTLAKQVGGKAADDGGRGWRRRHCPE
jgi:alanyl-tRNA synthetase